MSTSLKTPEQHVQQIHTSSSNTSNNDVDRVPSVELQPYGATSKPASQLATDKNESTLATSSSASSANASQPEHNHDQTSTHNVSADTVLPRWYHTTNTDTDNLLIKVLRTTKLLVIWNWICGPSPPRTITFKPFFPRWQSLPSRYLSKWLGKPRGELIFVITCFVLWLIVFSVLLATSATASIAGFSAQQPVRLSCIASLWENAPTCGIDGKNCEPFDGQPFAFLCPANCLGVQVLDPYIVGEQEIAYRPLVIGGPNASENGVPVYRGDSFICGSAIHAGVITNQRGGCGLLTRQAEQTNFPAVERNGINSIEFSSSFPLTFSISSVDANCDDPQWSAFAVSVLFTALISLVVSSAVVFTATIFVIVFFQIGLISSAPYYTDFSNVISTAFSRFLPAVFIIVVVYRYCIRKTLRGVQAPWERTILWLGGCWVGAMNDYTFGEIPIRRLTPRDLQQQPGAIVALIIIVLVIVAVAIGQVWFYRLEGRLPRYLGFYICIGVIIGCLNAIPSLQFRLHHYILALLLLPGTALKTRPTMLYQGLLVGLFINGVARWGFASILQTPASLLGNAQSGTAQPTDIVHDIIADTIRLNFTELADGWDGLSILVNDVERYQQSRLDLPASFNWTRADPDVPLFFRFAYTATYTLGGVFFGDYTKASIWYPNGTWYEMPPEARL